jgi:hypothetical protein
MAETRWPHVARAPGAPSDGFQAVTSAMVTTKRPVSTRSGITPDRRSFPTDCSVMIP